MLVRASFGLPLLPADEKEQIRVILGFRSHYLQRVASQMTTLFTPLDSSKQLLTLQRIQQELTCDLSHSDESSRIDSNSARCATISCNSAKMKHPGRTLEVSAWQEKHSFFKEIYLTSACLNNHSNFEIPSKSSFCKYSFK